MKQRILNQTFQTFPIDLTNKMCRQRANSSRDAITGKSW